MACKNPAAAVLIESLFGDGVTPGKTRLVKQKLKVMVEVLCVVDSKKINEEELQELFPEGMCVCKSLTRNTLDCDQSNYSSRIVFSHIPFNLVKKELALFDPPTTKTPS